MGNLSLSLDLMGGGGTGGGAWEPTTPGSLIRWGSPRTISTLWQNSARTSPVTATTQQAAAEDDLSGAGNHFLALTSDANGPVYTTANINGLPALVYNGINHKIGKTLAANISAFTFFAVIKPASLTNEGAILVDQFLAESNTGSLSLTFGVTANTTLAVWVSDVGRKCQTANGTIAAGTAYIVALTYQDPNMAIWINGASVKTDTYVGGFLKRYPALGNSAAWGVPFTGAFGDDLLYNTKLNDANMASAFAYLNGIWGIY